MAKDRRTYANAGVDDLEAIEGLKRALPAIQRTHTFADIIGWGLFTTGIRIGGHSKPVESPVLFAKADGTGTVTYEAVRLGNLERIGYSVVCHVLADNLTAPAEPMAVLDIIDAQRHDRAVIGQLLIGMARACEEVGVPLLGGETAALPALILRGEQVVNAVAIGIADEPNIVNGRRQPEAGDMLIGLTSIGIHLNGLSLARQQLLQFGGLGLDDYLEELGTTVGEELTRGMPNYEALIGATVRKWAPTGVIHGLAHITGGGIMGNLYRILPPGLTPRINYTTFPCPPIFRLIFTANHNPNEHYHVDPVDWALTFNLGLGFVIACQPSATDGLLTELTANLPGPIQALVVGEIIESK